MTISVTCACGANYRVSVDKRGKQLKCRVCETLIRVPREVDQDVADIPSDGEPAEVGSDRLEPLPPTPRARWKSRRNQNQQQSVSRPPHDQDDFKKRLWIGLGIGLAVAISGAVCISAGAAGIGKFLFAVVTLTVLAGVPYLSDQSRRRMIREDIERDGGTVRRISSAKFWWLPGGAASLLRNLDSRRYDHEVYRVTFSDRDGRQKTQFCRVNLSSGTAWGDAPYQAAVSQEWSRRGSWEIGAILSLLGLVAITGFFAYEEISYAINGKVEVARITRVDRGSGRTGSAGAGRRHSRSRNYLAVTYQFRDTNGTDREETVRVTNPLYASPKVGNLIKVEYLPGRKGWSRLYGLNHRGWVMIAAAGTALVGVLYAVIRVLDAFDVFQLNSRRRKKKRRPSDDDRPSVG